MFRYRQSNKAIEKKKIIEIYLDTHKAGKTHSGKNTSVQIEKDAQNLCEAQRCDLDVLRKN